MKDNIIITDLVIYLDYLTTYNMTINDPLYAELREENEFSFKDEVKNWVLEMATNDLYRIKDDNDKLYIWMYYNCIAVGLEVQYNRLIETLTLTDIEKYQQAEALNMLLIVELERLLKLSQ